MLCILYVTAIGTLLGVAGRLVERVLPATAPRRWVWCVVIAITMAVPPIYRTNHATSVTDVVDQQMVQPPSANPLAATSAPTSQMSWSARIESYNPIIHRLWLITSAVLIIWGLASAWRVSRILSLSRSGRGNAGGAAIVDDVPVVVTDLVGPATVGVLRSRVLVPRWVLALPGAQRRYVLRHEDEHRRAHDARLLFAMSLPIILTPWNLALWWQLRRLRLAVEMDCDNRVVSALGDATAYGELLLKVAQAASHGPRLQPALLGVGMLEQRLKLLLAPTPLRHAQRFLLPALAFALLFVVLSMPHPVLRHKSDAHVAVTAGTLPK
ncbi:MAG: M56 family metallopeptidase [Gemmatimonadaceae bacterium]